MGKKLSESRKRLLRRVKDRNRKFQKLSLEKQRVKIAQDVIEQLQIKRFIARTGIYASVPVIPVRVDPEEQFNLALESARGCHVCGIGGVFLSAVRINDDMTYSEAMHGSMDSSLGGVSLDDGMMRKYLRKWFSDHQLSLIESAFETKFMGTSNDHRKLTTAVAWGDRFDKSKDRLKAICQNIIDNNGKFVPSKIKDS